jgi:hypothetical protein
MRTWQSAFLKTRRKRGQTHETAAASAPVGKLEALRVDLTLFPRIVPE